MVSKKNKKMVNVDEVARLRERWWAVTQEVFGKKLACRTTDVAVMRELFESGIPESEFFAVARMALRVPYSSSQFKWTNLAREIEKLCKHFGMIQQEVYEANNDKHGRIAV